MRFHSPAVKAASGRRLLATCIAASLLWLVAMPAAAAPASEPTVESLVKGLESPESLVRSRSLTALVQERKAPDALKYAIAAMKDPAWYNRMNAARLLGEIGNPGAVDALVAALVDEKWNVRELAAESLGKIGDVRAAEALLAAVKSPFPDVRVRASNILTLVRFPEATVIFRKALSDPNPAVRLTAALAIQTTEPADLGPLTTLLDDPEPSVRAKASTLLARLKKNN